MSVTIYHNPRCTKSRATLELLKEKGITPNIVEYLKTPLAKNEIAEIAKLLAKEPKEFIRKGENKYKELGLAEASSEQLIEAMAENPILIERPIVIANGKAAIGRPPEDILSIL